MKKANLLKIEGIVQGVGFRPFVYRLAKARRLKGEVTNTPEGLYIHIEGDSENIDAFCKELQEKAPPVSHISKFDKNYARIENFTDFFIEKSRQVEALQKSVHISPDLSICDDCISELLDPDDRRYGYPFINCTNCGPRFSIIEDVPYDRCFTTMRHFKMCKKCQSEYDNPLDRRFHAQPNACPDCGPRIWLCDNNRNIVNASDPIDMCAKFLKQGYIIALKGLGGFHLAADASNSASVALLRKRKKRKEKPFALMSYDIEQIKKYAYINEEDRKILESFCRPILLVEKKDTDLISDKVSRDNNYYGVMLPYTPLHCLLLQKGFTALVMTSGNIGGEPIAKTENEAFGQMSDIADYFLIHNREIYVSCDDSIVKRVAGMTQIIRRSRGYAPAPLFLKNKVIQTLACGGELKNTVCITKGNNAFLSQYIGDIKSVLSYDFFKKSIRHLMHVTGAMPEIIAFDMHPDYMSSRYARNREKIEKIPVQHHHAHICACMAENKIEEDTIGIALDGTGYGTDNNIWGGEVLIAGYDKFVRKAHISYLSMPGGDVAVKEPWRMAVSALFDAFGEDIFSLNIPFFRIIEERRIKFIVEMILKKVNSPYTSSLGRLFDAVASIVGIGYYASFEAQLAMRLETICEKENNDSYDVMWGKKNDLYEISFRSLIRGIIEDMNRKIPPETISAKFHNTITDVFSTICEKIRAESDINQVALSGGVFQNSIILTDMIRKLEAKKFKVAIHRLTPCNDGSISLGQAVIADAIGS